LHSPKIGWAEEEPAQWWSNVCAITRELIAASGIEARQIAAVGVTGMLPAVVLLDHDGNVLRPSIQQSDARCGAEVREIAREFGETNFLARTGNGVNQQIVAAKLRWLRRHQPAVFDRIDTVFGSYDYVNWKLTGEKAVEQNWALEAGFTRVSTGEMDDELIALGGIERSAIPRRTVSHALLGYVTDTAARATGLPRGLPVVGGAADHVASALAAGVVSRGDVLLKFGGSVDVLTASDKLVTDPRMFLDYHLIPGLFMPNGCMSTGGSGLNWFAATFARGEAAAAESAERTIHQHLDHLAESVAPGADGVWALPHFLGEKTPIHDPGLRGLFGGLNFAMGVPHLWRSLLESYA
jgi:xylulokinase